MTEKNKDWDPNGEPLMPPGYIPPIRPVVTSSSQPQQKKPDVALIILLSVVGIIIIGVVGFFLLLNSFTQNYNKGVDDPEPDTYSSQQSLPPVPTSGKPLDYDYGQTSTKEKEFGLDSSYLSTIGKYSKTISASGSVIYDSTDRSCRVIVDDTYDSTDYIGTGNDEAASVTLLKNNNSWVSTDPAKDSFFNFQSASGNKYVAPVKYSDATAEVKDAGTQYLTVYARVISAGEGKAVTVTTNCSTPEKRTALDKQIETNFTFETESMIY